MNKIGEGREAEIFAWDGGRVLRLLRDPDAGEKIDQQIAALGAARQAGVPVPEAFEKVFVDDRPGLVMERVEGPDQLTLLGSKPWLVFRAARVLGTVHARLHDVDAPGGLPSLRSSAQARIAAGPLPSRLAEFALSVLDSLPDGDRLCHGDYHPGNILMAGDGPVVIDWTNVTRGDPCADVARTRLLLEVGELPPGAPALVRRLLAAGRAVMRWTYLRTYNGIKPVDPDMLARWKVVRAAERLAAEGIEGEEEKLTQLLEAGHRAARRAPP